MRWDGLAYLGWTKDRGEVERPLLELVRVPHTDVGFYFGRKSRKDPRKFRRLRDTACWGSGRYRVRVYDLDVLRYTFDVHGTIQAQIFEAGISRGRCA
jgi:hypothetical protein